MATIKYREIGCYSFWLLCQSTSCVVHSQHSMTSTARHICNKWFAWLIVILKHIIKTFCHGRLSCKICTFRECIEHKRKARTHSAWQSIKVRAKPPWRATDAKNKNKMRNNIQSLILIIEMWTCVVFEKTSMHASSVICLWILSLLFPLLFTLLCEMCHSPASTSMSIVFLGVLFLFRFPALLVWCWIGSVLFCSAFFF